jgi:hypothetical protein
MRERKMYAEKGEVDMFKRTMLACLGTQLYSLEQLQIQWAVRTLLTQELLPFMYLMC